MRTEELVDIFVKNICRNFNIPASLRVSKPFCGRNERHLDSTIYLDLLTTSSFTYVEEEILASINANQKDYRKLRSLIRRKLISAVKSIRDLADESLRNLGAK